MSEEEKQPLDPEELKKSLQEFFKNRFPGGNPTIITAGIEPEAAEEPPPAPTEKKGRVADALRFDLIPAQVKAHLDRFVIGQDEAKKSLAVAICDHYNHVRRMHAGGAKSEPIDYVKQNLILIGPTGVGKTYLLRTIAQLIGVPFVKADITKFSETGYVGGDVDDLVRELVRMADGDVQLAEYGIIFLDEIDKIASSTNLMGRDVSGRGVQTGLLKLLEETEVPARSPNDISAQFQELMQMRRGQKGKRMINTRHILFVVSGAFTGLGEIIEKRLSERSIGFAAATGTIRAQDEHIFNEVSTRDFVEYGFEPEFIGRLPIRVALQDLTEDDLYIILTTSEGSILKQHRESFRGYGIDVEFQDEALRAVSKKAIQEKTGARGLMTILESALRPFKFHMPGTPIKQLLVTPDAIEDPSSTLAQLLADPATAERDFAEAEARRFEGEFAQREHVRLRLDASSVAMATAVAKELHMKIPEYLETVFGAHAEFLRRAARKAGRSELAVSPRILNRPEDGEQVWSTPE